MNSPEIEQPENHTGSNETSTGAKILLVLVALIATCLVLFLVEGVLTIAGVGPSGNLFLKKDVAGEQFYQQNRDISEFFFPKWAAKQPGFETFPVEKSENCYRILATGASTTVGDPFGPQMSFPIFLEQMLQDLAPDRKIEVANCGVIAISSLDVLMLHHDAMSYDPDAILIYCGHNEAYGADGIDTPVQSAFTSRGAAKFWLKFRNLRLVRLVRNLVGSVRPKGGSGTGEEGFGMWLMKDRLVTADSDKHNQLLAHYEANITEMLASAGDKGIDVILCTLISNLRDQSPFGSAHSQAFPVEKTQEWEKLHNRGRASMSGERWSDGADLFRECIALDPGYAESYFRLGRCLDALGDSTAALIEYRKARDYDAVHFRACSDENEILRRISAEWDTEGKHQLVFVDLDQMLYEQFPAGPGRKIFTEHVHPYVSGYLWIAEQIAGALAGSELAAVLGLGQLDDLRDRQAYLDQIGISGADEAAGLILTDEFKMAKWPFINCYDNIENRSFIQSRIRDLYNQSKPMDQQLLNAVRQDKEGNLFDFGWRHYTLFAYYKDQRMGAEALRELEITQNYWLPAANLEIYYAQILLGLGRLNEAESHLEIARQLDPDYAPIHFITGAIHHSRGNLDSAFTELQTYLRLEPEGSYSAPAIRALEIVSRQRRGAK